MSLVTGSAQAAPRLEVGLAVGDHDFAEDVELGTYDHMEAPGPISAALLALRAGLQFHPRLGAEAELVAVPSRDSVSHARAMVYGVRGQLRFDILTGRLKPFLVLGGGSQVLRTQASPLHDDADPALHWGPGVRYAVNSRLDVRLDLRHLVVPDREAKGATSDFEGMLGVSWAFGGKTSAEASRATEAVDQDGDGVPNAQDQCPRQAEDRDGHLDEDGCPDLDNDGDGVADVSDRCPAEAEAKNGYLDDDGCADELLRELAGVTFLPNSTLLDAGASQVLDHAVALLAAHATLSVVIEGHTSAEGNVDSNLLLAVARAETVKAYLVAHGIAAARLTTVGYGSERPIADNTTNAGRQRNRRIEFRIAMP